MIAAVLLLLAAILPVAQPGPQEAGFVIETRGRWTIVRGRAALPSVTRGTPILEGDLLRRDDLNPDSFFIIALYTGDVQRLTATTTMEAPIEATTLSRIMKAIRQRFEEGFVSASVRGGAPFEDAVIAAAGTLDLRRVFRHAAPGRSYQISARAITAGRVSADPPIRGRVRVATAAVSFPSLPTGVYQLDIAGSGAAESGSVWIGVVPSPQYLDSQRIFEQLARGDDGSSAEVQGARRSLARAYLLNLNERP